MTGATRWRWLGLAMLGALASGPLHRRPVRPPGCRRAAAGLPPLRERILGASEAIGATPGDGGAAREAVAAAFVTGIHLAELLASLALATGAVMALMLLRPRGCRPLGPSDAEGAELTGSGEAFAVR